MKTTRPRRRRRLPKAWTDPSGDPRQMRELGESISGWQPDIGHKDTGVGRRLKEGVRRPTERRRPRRRVRADRSAR